MALISGAEIMRAGIVIAFLGYIFMDTFRSLRSHTLTYNIGFDMESFKFAALITAPAVILHELGHKFVAMIFGMQAEFFAAYTWLIVGVALKLLGVGAIFFIPGYVSWGCPAFSSQCIYTLSANPWIGSVIAFAGPGLNLAIWQGANWYMKNKKVKKKHVPAVLLTGHINKFLFFFNMIPIPPFDGYGVVSGLFRTLF